MILTIIQLLSNFQPEKTLDLFMSKGYILNSNKNNSKCVSTLLNVNNWKNFVNTLYASYAIGGSTIEMWCESWNSKGYSKLYYNNVDDIGYYIGGKSKPGTTNIHMDSTTGFADKLYYPHPNTEENVSECLGYRLASTVATNSDNVMLIGNDGVVGHARYGSAKWGIRPVVCLKQQVQAEKIDNIWVLE